MCKFPRCNKRKKLDKYKKIVYSIAICWERIKEKCKHIVSYHFFYNFRDYFPVYQKNAVIKNCLGQEKKNRKADF